MDNFKAEMDQHGRFRIVNLDTGEASEPTHYRGIAVLEQKDGRKFIAVSDYFAGELKACTAYEIVEKKTIADEECCDDLPHSVIGQGKAL